MEVWEYGAIRNRGVEVWEYGAIRNRGMWSGSMGICTYIENGVEV